MFSISTCCCEVLLVRFELSKSCSKFIIKYHQFVFLTVQVREGDKTDFVCYTIADKATNQSKEDLRQFVFQWTSYLSIGFIHMNYTYMIQCDIIEFFILR